MTDLTSDPEFVDEPPTRSRWRSWRRLFAQSASASGLRRGLALILLPSLLLVGVEVYKAVNTVPALRQSQALVERSFEIITAAHSLDQAIQDAERGQRGFVITGDDAYLRPYFTGVRDTPGKLDDLRQLTRDSSEQQPHVELLAAQIKTKLAELQQTIAVRRERGI